MNHRNSAIRHWRDQNPTAPLINLMYIKRSNLLPNATPNTAFINCREPMIMPGFSAEYEHEYKMHENFFHHLRNRNFVEAANFLYFYLPEFSTSEEVCYIRRRHFVLVRGVEPIVDRSLCHIGCLEDKPIFGYEIV